MAIIIVLKLEQYLYFNRQRQELNKSAGKGEAPTIPHHKGGKPSSVIVEGKGPLEKGEKSGRLPIVVKQFFVI